ncbi:MAG: RNA-directed DNA polymerase [Magnetococcus sp. YQC-3]
MSIVNPKYRRLYPKKSLLTDEVVLIQAWKKTQHYIRKRNWYADLLELDQSAVLLEDQVKKWAAKMKDEDVSFRPQPMRMVPAPKTHRWGFEDEKWLPIETEKEGRKKKTIHLRPLSHLGVCEQTLATAAMLCLADCVETAQGDTGITDYFEARRRGIHSYGNRLHCSFDHKTTCNSTNRPKALARFHWGNSETYNRYYKDYARFLERPRIIAANVQDTLGDNEELYVVKLDITAFFDHIHRPSLIKRLMAEHGGFIKDFLLRDGDADLEFWDALTQITQWEWNDADDGLKKYLNNVESMPNGLPQGLVASGFFANAYLLDFDRCISGMLMLHIDHKNVEKALKTVQSSSGWNRDMGSAVLNGEWDPTNKLWSCLPDLPNITIHDYCRYVDDIRLVISLKGRGLPPTELGNKITEWIDCWLNAAANPAPGVSPQHKLTINSGKTEVIPFRLMEGQVGITSRMALIQNELSGPADMDALTQTTDGLDALLSLADQFDCCDPQDKASAHPLASIASPKTEVRDDTIKRYAAYRLLRALRMRRTMTDLEAEIEPGLKARDAIDHEMEMFARKLVRAWSHDPSLSLVLRYAMELFSSPALLQPVLDSLRKLITESDGKSEEEDEKFCLVGGYVCADLLRAGAMETGFQARDLEMPESADLPGYRSLLLDFAREVLNPAKPLGKKSSWYVRQQALLLLAVLDPCPVIESVQEIETQHYTQLLKIAGYPPMEMRESDLVLAMVLQQIHPAPRRFAKWFVDSLQYAREPDRLKHLQMVAFNRPDLMAQTLDEIESLEPKPDWIDKDNAYLKLPKGMRYNTRDLSDLDGVDVALWKIVSHTDNPFRQEIQWLKLACALIDKIHRRKDDDEAQEKFSLHNLTIKVKNWKRLQRPELGAGKLEVDWDSNGPGDPRLVTPHWCVTDKRWFYALGRLLRSVITGEQDFTLTPYLNRNNLDHYVGMRNNWFSRRQGMMHTPESLAGGDAPFSPWVSELLILLLQWPGVQVVPRLIQNWEEVDNLEDLSSRIKDRLAHLAGIYGNASRLPVYPICIARDHFCGQGGSLRVALVQTLVPKQADYTKGDPCLDNPVYRAQHRRHISALCHLVKTQLKAQRSVEEMKTQQAWAATADLIVLPELSVHPNDVWILKRLSDVTKAMLFFGLTPLQNCAGKLVNAACWLIPDQQSSGRSWIIRYQGKQHPTAEEKGIGVQPWRPYQVVIELPSSETANRGYRLTGAICYDATDLNLVADMRNISDMFVIPAMNRDVSTFDNMVSALHYHMFQHVALVNTGEFGGSTVQAPFQERHLRTIIHQHGGDQLGVSIFDVNVNDFGPTATTTKPPREKKTKPAGFNRFV